jgi:dimeric dUTPase (all-alpha-NTP-PPase superfamily)
MTANAFKCAPELNVKCNKSRCYVTGGPCSLTANFEYSVNAYTEEPLKHMLAMQEAFQDRVDARCKSEDLVERAAFLRDHFVFCDQELQEMLYEIPHFKHWKDYSKMTEEEIEEAYSKAKDELIDAWHFFMNLSIGLGMGADEFYERYLAKHKENIRRQDEGYDHTMKHI